MYKLLFHHLRENSPISGRQWGFLPERSAQSALQSVTYDWLQYLENGNKIAMLCVLRPEMVSSYIPHMCQSQAAYWITLPSFLQAC